MAEEKLLAALDLFRTTEVAYLTDSAFESLGNLYQATGLFEKANGFYEQAFQVRHEMPSKKNLANTLQYLGPIVQV